MSVAPGSDPSQLEAQEAAELLEHADGRPHVDAHPGFHPVDPNDGVVVADPPGRAALLLAAAIALVTILALVLVAVAVASATGR